MMIIIFLNLIIEPFNDPIKTQSLLTQICLMF